MSSYFWFLFRIMVSQFFGSLCVLVSVWVFYVLGPVCVINILMDL